MILYDHPLGPPPTRTLPKVLRVWYREEETAVLLQSTQESQEGHAGYDDAGDQQYVGNAEFGQVGAERSQFEVQRQVHAKAQHCHAAHLTERKCTQQSRSATQKHPPE